MLESGVFIWTASQKSNHLRKGDAKTAVWDGINSVPRSFRLYKILCNKQNPQLCFISIEVKVNKEVRDFQESVFFGLTLRQCLFALAAILAAVAVYFGLRNIIAEAGWLCVIAAFPFALGGFFKYNGMNLEQFLWAFIKSAVLCPKRLAFKSDNLYAKLLERSSIKEALRLD